MLSQSFRSTPAGAPGCFNFAHLSRAKSVDPTQCRLRKAEGRQG